MTPSARFDGQGCLVRLGFRAEPGLYLSVEQREAHIGAPSAPSLGRQCASLRGRGLLRARVRFKDLPKLALTLANDFEEVPR
jgi:hypothetical protein